MPGPPFALRAAVADADLETLVRDASRHGLAGSLRHALDKAGVALPLPARDALAHQALAGTAAAMRVKRLLFKALDALEAQGVRPVLLKGYGLGSRLYAAPTLRPSSDVDLLVAPKELAAARAGLAALGLSPKADSDDFYPKAYQHHEAFAGPAGLVELHFRLMANWGEVWDSAALRRRSVEGALDGREVRYLRPEDELVYLALHAANHLLGRVGWLFDLKLFVLAYPALDWQRVQATAKEARMKGPAFYALDAAQRLVNAAIPAETLNSLAPASAKVAAARRLFSEARLLDGYLAEHKRVWAGAKFLLADSPAKVALFAARRLVWNARRDWLPGG
jgi:hypothetical protein